MSDVQRPTLLAVLAVLAIIGGVLSCVGAIGYLLLIGGSFAAGGVGIGIMLIIWAILSVGVGIFGLMAGIKVMGNKPDGVDKMKKYAIASLAVTILVNIVNKIAGLQVSLSGVIISIVISVAILAYLFTNEDVKTYESSLQQ